MTIAVNQPMRVHTISNNILTWDLSKPCLQVWETTPCFQCWSNNKIQAGVLCISQNHQIWHAYISDDSPIYNDFPLDYTIIPCGTMTLLKKGILISRTYLGLLKKILIHHQKYSIATNYMNRLYKLMRISGLTLMAVL